MGCIHLSEPKGDEVGWFSLAALEPDELVGYLVNVSGYPGDRGAGQEQYHGSNRVLRATERRLFYEVDTSGGQSGAPVWIHKDDAAAPLAVGIHAYGVGGTPSDLGIVANSAPRIIREVLETLKGWVEQDGGWPGGLSDSRIEQAASSTGVARQCRTPLVAIVESTVPMPEIALLGDAGGRFRLRLPPGPLHAAGARRGRHRAGRGGGRARRRRDRDRDRRVIRALSARTRACARRGPARAWTARCRGPA